MISKEKFESLNNGTINLLGINLSTHGDVKLSVCVRNHTNLHRFVSIYVYRGDETFRKQVVTISPNHPGGLDRLNKLIKDEIKTFIESTLVELDEISKLLSKVEIKYD